MSEVLFYHAERASLEDVLPGLLERTRERGWKALVRVGSDERAAALDTHLWTYKEESFLPHGRDHDTHPTEQPILLTVRDGNANGAEVLFLADGAEPQDWGAAEIKALARVVLIFDGRDPAAVDSARTQWTHAKAAGHEVTYWQQSATGKWEKRA
jgi:DNA polymerase III subunit chi